MADDKWTPGPKRDRSIHIQAWLDPKIAEHLEAVKVFRHYQAKGKKPLQIVLMAFRALAKAQDTYEYERVDMSHGQRLDYLEQKIQEILRVLQSGDLSGVEHQTAQSELSAAIEEMSEIQRSVADRYSAIDMSDIAWIEDDE